MDNSILIELIKQSVVGAGFFYLLFYLIKNMESITCNLVAFGQTLGEVSVILSKLDMRIEQIEQRISLMEQRI